MGLLYTLCVITVKWVATGAGNKVSKHLQLIQILVLSPQVMVYIAWVLAKHIQVWNQDSVWWYGVREVQTTLQALFQSTITGVVVQGFRSSSVPVTHEGYLVESRSSQANHSVFNTLSRHSLLAAVSRSTSVIGLCLGSSASLSSPFSNSCYIGSHCSAFLSC